jgi:hypothetical protein
MAKPHYRTVADIPDSYALLQGDEARDYTETGCAFVLVGEGEITSAYVTECSVPWLTALVERVV